MFSLLRVASRTIVAIAQAFSTELRSQPWLLCAQECVRSMRSLFCLSSGHGAAAAVLQTICNVPNRLRKQINNKPHIERIHTYLLRFIMAS